PARASAARAGRCPPPGGVSPLSRHHRLELVERTLELLPGSQAHLDHAEARESAQLAHDAQLDLRPLARLLEDHTGHRLAQEALERRLFELLTPHDLLRRLEVDARPVEADGTP